MSKLSEQLFELMAEDGYQQTTLAKAMNTSSSKLSLYLADKCMPDFENFVALSEFFHCSADYLLGLSEYPQRGIPYRPVPPFGIRLRTLLREKSKSQYNLIQKTGLSWSILHNWLIGKSLPSAENLLRLANYFNCSVDFLLGREP